MEIGHASKTFSYIVLSMILHVNMFKHAWFQEFNQDNFVTRELYDPCIVAHKSTKSKLIQRFLDWIGSVFKELWLGIGLLISQFQKVCLVVIASNLTWNDPPRSRVSKVVMLIKAISHETNEKWCCNRLRFKSNWRLKYWFRTWQQLLDSKRLLHDLGCHQILFQPLFLSKTT